MVVTSSKSPYKNNSHPQIKPTFSDWWFALPVDKYGCHFGMSTQILAESTIMSTKPLYRIFHSMLWLIPMLQLGPAVACSVLKHSSSPSTMTDCDAFLSACGCEAQNCGHLRATQSGPSGPRCCQPNGLKYHQQFQLCNLCKIIPLAPGTANGWTVGLEKGSNQLISYGSKTLNPRTLLQKITQQQKLTISPRQKPNSFWEHSMNIQHHTNPSFGSKSDVNNLWQLLNKYQQTAISDMNFHIVDPLSNRIFHTSQTFCPVKTFPTGIW